MRETTLDLQSLREEARAGRLTHVLSVLSVLLRQVRSARTPEDAERFAAAVEAHWSGPVLRIAPMAIGVSVERDQEHELTRLAQAISQALVGSDVPGLVNVLRVPAAAAEPAAAEPAGSLEDERAPQETLLQAAPSQAERGEPPPSERATGARDDSEAMHSLLIGFGAVLSQMSANSEAMSAALQALREGAASSAPAPNVAELAQAVAGMLAEQKSVDRLPLFDAHADSFRRLMVGFGAVLRRLSAHADTAEQAIATLREGALGGRYLGAEVDRLREAAATLEALSNRAPPEPVIVTLDARSDFQRILIGHRAVLRDLSASADAAREAAASLASAKPVEAVAAPRAAQALIDESLRTTLERIEQRLASLAEPPQIVIPPQAPPQVVTLDARSDFQRVLIGHRTVLRDLSASADLARDAAQRLAESSSASSSPSSSSDGLQDTLGRLEGAVQSLHGLAERMADRQEVAASAFFEAEKVGLHRIMVGFRATLRAMTEQTQAVAAAPAQMGQDLAETLARIEAQLEQLKQAGPPAPQVVTLDARSDFQRVLVGHRTVLRELAASAEAARAAADKLAAADTPSAGSGASSDAVLQRLDAVTARLDQMAARDQSSIGSDVMERLLTTVAEAIAQAERRAAERLGVAAVIAAPQAPAASAAMTPLMALSDLTRQVERVQRVFETALQSVEAAALSADSVEAASAAQVLSTAVERGARDARDLFADFLNVAAALTREWENGADREAAALVPPPRRGLVADARMRSPR